MYKNYLKIFVYGTLKIGKSNHGLLQGNCKIVNGWTVGNLYDIGGFPMLWTQTMVPHAKMKHLVESRKDLNADLIAQVELDEALGCKRVLRDVVRGASVWGEVATFRGPEDFLAEVLDRLDNLEGFVGDPLRDMYKRVLLPVETARGVGAAWAYVKGDNYSLGDSPKLLGGVWRGQSGMIPCGIRFRRSLLGN